MSGIIEGSGGCSDFNQEVERGITITSNPDFGLSTLQLAIRIAIGKIPKQVITDKTTFAFTPINVTNIRGKR